MNATAEQTASQTETTAVVAAICHETAAACELKFGRAMRALVLSGSLARGEGTFVGEDGRYRALGDAEFFLVTALPAGLDVAKLGQSVESSLCERGILCHVEISPVDSKYLRALPRRILSYELKKCGKVVSGEPDILSLIPEFEPAEIILEDAWRLLANRMVEQLEMIESLTPGLRELPEGLYYRTMKLYLDMATSLLAFLGAYQPSYGARARSLSLLAESISVQDGLLPFPLDRFSEIVRACTQLKLGGIVPRPGRSEVRIRPSFEFWEEAIGYARKLWRWELERLTSADGSLSDGELLEKYAGSQPMAERLRGWAYVARACGLIRTSLEWPRWIFLSRRGSPRYLVYAAASDLLFHLPALVKSGQLDLPERARAKRMGSMPVTERRYSGDAGWKDLAADISMNYHRFVERTRA